MVTEVNYLYFRGNNQAAIHNFTSISMPIFIHLFCINKLQNTKAQKLKYTENMISKLYKSRKYFAESLKV
jgi:hypothetical protein